MSVRHIRKWSAAAIVALLSCVNSSVVASESEWSTVWTLEDARAASTSSHIESVSMTLEMMRILADAGNVTHLRMVNADSMEAEGWGLLSKFKKLVHLEVGYNENEPGNYFGKGYRVLNMSALPFLTNFPTLETLILYSMVQDKQDDALVWLKKLPKLKRIEFIRCGRRSRDNLDYFGLGKEALQTIASLIQLEALTLDSRELNDDFVKQVAAFPGLNRLSLEFGNLTQASIDALAGAMKLECLHMHCNVEGWEGAGLEKFPKLAELSIHTGGFGTWKRESFECLKRVKGLRRLAVNTGGVVGVLPLAAQLPQLESLTVVGQYGATKDEKEQIEKWSLSGLKNLKYLRLVAVPVDDKQLGSIFAIAGLESLTIIKPFHITEAGMLGIDKLKGLKNLILERALHSRGVGDFVDAAWLTKAVLLRIAALEKLQRLDLAGFLTERTKDGKVTLLDSTQGVTDETLPLLAAGKSLRFLSFRTCSISLKKLVEVVTGMKELRHLNACDGAFENEQLEIFVEKRPDMRISTWKPPSR